MATGASEAVRPKVLVTRRLPAGVLEPLTRFFDVDLFDESGDMTAKELTRRVGGVAGLVCVVTDSIDREVLDAGEDLQIIANIAVGYDNIDVSYAASRGVVVSNTPDVLTEAVAELTWGLILSVTRRLAEGDRLIRAGRWTRWSLEFMLGTELRGKRLGIVGPGRIGTAVAKRAAVFGMEVAGAGRVDRSTSSPTRNKFGYPVISLDELLVSADVVSLHVPLNASTRHLIDRRRLARMKRSAYLVNTSRGPVVDEAALAWALHERVIAGAALDVHEHEPQVHPDFRSVDNIVLIPHLGSGTHETRKAMADLAVANVASVLSGKPPLTPVQA
jgi:glyoxylate reductase